ncbi:acetyl-CoA synthetase isoform [Nadsonia fulvescens var. elongata DSM 6958]|uniref:Acetyl-coenzyme A synthetase n=1 Tax=Nadsonia fulvescens var. elongata DSM 6958 TaxID=857566 RepID=A0A1E3PK64_9ASCO|nr:acetyl-CoA synthetase isoform [Nadsonia fulvescens var. elongata DSM 6958]
MVTQTEANTHNVVHEAQGVGLRFTPKAYFTKHPSQPHLSGLDHYQSLYQESITQPEKFFGKLARELLTWDQDFTTVLSGGFEYGDTAWFLEGKLNASYNCVDRHAFVNPDKPALIYEADDPNDSRTITFAELLREISKVAHTLTAFGVQKGDTVAVYLPMIPEALIALLAISRIGAIHSVIFAGFSSGSLGDRIIDANCKVIVTTDEGRRGGKTVYTKKIVDEGLKNCPSVEKVLVFQRTGGEIPWITGRDFWWHEEVAKYRPYSTPVPVAAEDPLFLLYTSGSTGTPKGLVHCTGGYLLGAAATTKYIFDIHDDDIFFTAGDIGWITGHTYAMYGPLLLGATTVIFEGTPAYPDYSRYWQIIEKYRVTQFYVAPTALRLLKRAGEEFITKHDLSSLRSLGSVGEPIAPEIWEWYHAHIGNYNCHISDTYWQTETGSHIIAPISGTTPMKPGAATLPFFGIDLALIDPVSSQLLEGNDVEGVLAIKAPWPSMARSVWNSHSRYVETYFNPYPGYYFTGDGAARDHDGYYWIRGRVDDVVNVSGHRLSTSEIEAVLITHEAVGESAVVGITDDLTGQAVIAFISLKAYVPTNNSTLKKDLIGHVRKQIGPFATPKRVLIVEDLPKTRSGKIVRRILRKIVSGESDSIGDLSTLGEPQVVTDIIEAIKNQI